MSITINLFAQTTQYSEVQITLEENWVINNQSYTILRTVITGSTAYTIHLLVDSKPTMESESKDFAKEVAKHAIKNGYLKNAIKYNNYSSQFYIYDDVIGVVLMHMDDPETQTVTLRRFGFTNEELGNIPVINELISTKFQKKEEMELVSKIKDIIESRYYEDLIDLYTENDLDKKFIEETKLKTTVFFNLAKEIQVLDNSILIYKGIKSGVKGFDFYIPIKITPFLDSKKILNAFIKVLIVDDEPQYGIYNIELNFPHIEDYYAFVLTDDITLPIKKR